MTFPKFLANCIQGFYFRVRGRHPTPVKRGKMHNKGKNLGIIFCEYCFTSFHICVTQIIPYYTICCIDILYQIIWTLTDPENGGFWKTYLDKEKMLVTSSFSCYYNVFYSTLTKSNFCHLQMLSIWTYQKFCHFVWRYEALKYTRSFFLWIGEMPRGQQVGKKKKASILQKSYCLIFS